MLWESFNPLQREPPVRQEDSRTLERQVPWDGQVAQAGRVLADLSSQRGPPDRQDRQDQQGQRDPQDGQGSEEPER